jgi:ATP-binding cassette, subfamily B, bacterial PglK
MPNSHVPLGSLLRRLWVHINPRRRIQFGLLFLVMILASFAEVISIGSVLPFLGVLTAPDRIFEHAAAQPLINALGLTEPKQLMLPLTIVFSVGAICSGLMRLIQLILVMRLSHAAGADLSVSIYQRTLYQPYKVHVSRNSSEVIAGISIKANAVIYVVIMPMLNMLSSVLMLSFLLLTLIIINPVVATSTFVGFGIIYGVVILSTKKLLLRNSQRVSKKTNQVFKALQEGLGGIRDVLIDRAQEVYCKIYRNADLPMRRGQANIAIISNSPRFGIEALGMVLIAVVAYSLTTGSKSFADSIPVLGALALGAQRALPMLQMLYASWSGLRGGQVALSDCLDLLDQPMPAYAIRGLLEPIPFNNSITLNNLTFKYTEDTPLVLKDGLNLSILKGSCIGFIGTTGSGKSTLLDILMGLLQPTIGSLEIDGVSIVEENHQSWLTHIAHVPQSIFLADTSIAENIAFGVPAELIDHARIRQVAQNAQLAETIESWSEQYDTMVGERGVRLSGGQRQRIAIARALYKKSSVIVFDEATSALDNDTERAVMEAIEDLDDDLTVIIVAHRLSTLKNCSQIVELKDGRIERIGSYQDIVEQKS